MSHSLTVDRKRDFLHVTVTGQNSPQTVAQYFAEIRQACRRHQCASVLIEENLAGPSLGTLDVFQLVAQGSEDARPAFSRIAYVDVNPEHSQPLMQFAETVAVNRGVNVRLFSNVRAAQEWLAGEAARSAS